MCPKSKVIFSMTDRCYEYAVMLTYKSGCSLLILVSSSMSMSVGGQVSSVEVNGL